MEQNFKVKFDDKDSYLKGMRDFMKLMSAWESNAEKFNRSFDIVPEVNESEGIYNLNVLIEVTEIKEDLPVN